MLNPERVSDVFGPDVEGMPTAHNALQRGPRMYMGRCPPPPLQLSPIWA